MKKLIIVIVLLIIIAVGGTIWWKNGLSPANPQNKEPVIFVVQPGDGVREISNRLKAEGLIKSRIAFFLLVKQLGLDKQIQAGDFRLYPSMTAEEIAQNLTHGTLDIWVTVPEGKRGAEIAEILEEKIPSYDSSWIASLVKEEGYLFPDTYLIPKDADIDMVINQMKGNFEEKFATIDIGNNNLSKEEIVILASLIEREAITNEEKPVIAGILVNRLDAGMALQVDATIQYAKGENLSNNKWWEPVTIDEYQSINSDYNTYLFTGLPPAPISNPGIEALRAAASPATTDFLYYLHDKNRKIRYAETLSQHNNNIEAYGVN